MKESQGKNTDETFLVVLQIGQEIPGINPQNFLPRPENEATFSCFALFKLWIIVSPKMFKQILADLFVIARKGHLINVPSFIEIH